MIRKSAKYLTGLGLLLAAVWSLAACKEATPLRGPHEPTEPAPPVQYSRVTKLHFRENFGWLFQVDVVAAEDGIQYELYKQDVLREEEPETVTRTFSWEPEVWEELLSVLEDNQVNTWKEQGYYLNACYNQQSTLFVECTDVEFLKEGDFFNITDSTAFLGSLHPPVYYGIDENEKKFRSDYEGYLELYVDGEDSPGFWKSYESYGLPEDYNRFRETFWDLVARRTDIPDWRLELGDWGRENLYKKYPYMYQEDQQRQIRYFSIFENYGYDGKGSPLAASVVYDEGKQTILYEFCGRVNIYSVGKSGQPVLYRQWGYSAGRGLKAEKEVTGIPERLPEILEKYRMESWEPDLGGTGYVRQGEFYNVENARKDRARKEQELGSDYNRILLKEQVMRSGYNALVHVVYTNGDHVEIRLENGRLPKAYNDFREELWDYMLICINEDVAEEEQTADWRDLLDQWGEEYMGERQPYSE